MTARSRLSADDIEDSRHGRLHAFPLNSFLSRPAAPVKRLCSFSRCAGRSCNSTTAILIGADNCSDVLVGRRQFGRTGIDAVHLHTRILQGGVRGRPNNMASNRQPIAPVSSASAAPPGQAVARLDEDQHWSKLPLRGIWLKLMQRHALSKRVARRIASRSEQEDKSTQDIVFGYTCQ